MTRVAAALLAILFATPAVADNTAAPTKQECVNANESAQDLQRAGKPAEARKKLETCAVESCPTAVREDCAQRLDELNKSSRETQTSAGKRNGTPERGEEGETCAKRSDCKEGLRCHQEKCAKLADTEEGEEQQRRVGFGLGFGGGGAAGTLRVIRRLDDTDGTPEVIIASVELSWYLPGEHAINLYVPLVNNVIGWGLSKGFVWNMDVMFTFNVGHGNLRFVAGPGVGFCMLLGQIFQDGPSVAGVGLRIPGEVGLEYLWDRHTKGVKFAVRPWIEVATERVDPGVLSVGSNINTTGAGILGMFVLSGFSLKPSAVP